MNQKPMCHIVGCDNLADWSVWDQQSPYVVDIVCSDHVPDLLIPGHSYTVEPWNTELDKKQKQLLLQPAGSET